MAGVATSTRHTVFGASSYMRTYGVAGVGLGLGMRRAEDSSVKAAELVRLEDFFSKLACGDHKSLYDEVFRSPRKAATAAVSESQRPPPSSTSQTTPLEPIALARTMSSESTSTTTTSTTTSESGDSVPSPSSSVSSLPLTNASAMCSDDCADVGDGNSSEENEGERPRGRTQTRATAERFKPVAQPLTYTAQFPGGTFSSYRPLPDRFMREEEKASGGGRFTFKMMLHDLYEDIDDFRKMVDKVLEDSKAKFQPLDKEATQRRRQSGEAKARGKGEERDRTMSNVEVAGDMEKVRRSVAERVAKRRRTQFAAPSDLGDNVYGHCHDLEHQDQPPAPSERVSPAVSTEDAADCERRVPIGDPEIGATYKILDEQNQYAVVFQPRTKRRLST